MRHAIAGMVGVSLVLGLCGCLDQQTGGVLPLVGSPAPDNANVTILLCLVPGPKHVAESETYKGAVARETGWRDVYVVHEVEWSELYRGRYMSVQQAQGDLKAAQTYRDSRGMSPFARALVMPLPPKEVGPPGWNVRRATGVFTVAVAEFYDVPESSYVGRRDFAVQCCRELRSQGLEAYYYHGPTKSIVSIGSFPESSYPSVDQGGTIRRVVRDGRIEAILKKFPYLAVNGRQELEVTQSKDGKRVRLATSCYVMEIPH